MRAKLTEMTVPSLSEQQDAYLRPQQQREGKESPICDMQAEHKEGSLGLAPPVHVTITLGKIVQKGQG